MPVGQDVEHSNQKGSPLVCSGRCASPAFISLSGAMWSLFHLLRYSKQTLSPTTPGNSSAMNALAPVDLSARGSAHNRQGRSRPRTGELSPAGSSATTTHASAVVDRIAHNLQGPQ